MSESPLGDINGTGMAHAPVDDLSKSLVDSVLDLNDFLSRDIRLARTQAAFYTKPDLEAEIDERNAELDSLTDSQGLPLPVMDESIADGERTAAVVAQELADLQKEYAASRQVVIFEQLDEDEWAAFQVQWKDALAKEPPYPAEFYADLIERCALRPKIPADKVVQLRKHLGAPAFEELWRKAWAVNTRSGVSIPKSLLSSVVLRQQTPG